MPGLVRKENKVQDNEHYILLAGKCLAVEAGVEALVDQSLTRLFSSVQKKQIPGYRVIRPLVDPILLTNEAGKRTFLRIHHEDMKEMMTMMVSRDVDEHEASQYLQSRT